MQKNRKIDRIERIQSNKCIDCNRLTKNGKKRCDKCAKRHNKNNKALKEKRKKLGLCPECGKPNTSGKYRCERCNTRNNEASLRRKQKIKYGYILCPKCNRKYFRPGTACVICTIEYNFNIWKIKIYQKYYRK